jgi:hypothetical protein
MFRKYKTIRATGGETGRQSGGAAAFRTHFCKNSQKRNLFFVDFAD